MTPDLVIATHEHAVDESVALLLDFLTVRGIAGSPGPARSPATKDPA